jgi:hypothetical protein
MGAFTTETQRHRGGRRCGPGPAPGAPASGAHGGRGARRDRNDASDAAGTVDRPLLRPALVEQVMNLEPYLSATHVFSIVDNGSSHRGAPACERLRKKWPNLILVHTPVHASWLNQIDIYFSNEQCSPFKRGSRNWRSRSSGSSRVTTCTAISTSWPSFPSLRDRSWRMEY